ncbi:MAG: DUF4260 domain-containing protein [Chloroflexi bacterium]|nr:DUF4260 domain-containing protein [Chloroflexota bacterium]
MSLPSTLLRIEGLALLISTVAIYAWQGYSGWAFVIFLLVPDLSALGYLIGPRIGAIAYNIAHTFLIPLGLGVVSALLGSSLGLQVALIWLAHIGMDRAVGYGLKYADGFKETHLNHV